MRLPPGLRTARPVLPVWLVVVVVGTGIMAVLWFYLMAAPWSDMGRIVAWAELPQTPLGWQPPSVSLVATGDDATIAIEERGATWIVNRNGRPEELCAGELGAFLRRWRAGPSHASKRLILRLHRKAPWSAVHALLATAAREGCAGVDLPLAWGLLRVAFADRDERGAPVVLAGLPLADPRGTRAEAGRRFSNRPRPVVRIAVPGAVEAQAVVEALACYADRDGTVRLARPD